MNLAKISANEQITVPVEIRNALRVKPGDKILFLQKPNGEVVVVNASIQALRDLQKSFTGVAEKLGLSNENDILALAKEIRKKTP